MLLKVKSQSFNLRNYTQKIVLKPPFCKYWADPFIIVKNDVVFVYFEEYDLIKQIGSIKMVIVDGDSISWPIDIIKEDFHLSFPFIYESGGSYYMVPESHQSNSIRLYKCIEFPGKWQYDGNLMPDINAVDTIIVTHNSISYLLTSTESDVGVDKRSALCVYFANEATKINGWSSLDKNPVSIKANGGRNAGNIVASQGSLFRVGQNNANSYGESISVFKILEISKESYEEVLYTKIEPKLPFEFRIHTFNTDSNYAVYDREIFRFEYWVSAQFFRILKMIKNK